MPASKKGQSAVSAVESLMNDIGIRADFDSFAITEELLSLTADETLSSGTK